jgi:hypothetical protein
LVQNLVPLLVELLVLLHVSVLHLFSLLGLLEKQLFSPLLEVLGLKFDDSVLRHFGL